MLGGNHAGRMQFVVQKREVRWKRMRMALEEGAPHHALSAFAENGGPARPKVAEPVLGMGDGESVT